MTEPYHLDCYDFVLPPKCVAQAPARPRDGSRLMVLPRRGDAPFSHHIFHELPTLLRRGDLLVVNRTKVIPARLRLRRPTGGKVELLLHRPVDGPLETARRWEGLGRPGSALQPGKEVYTAAGVSLQVVQRRGAMSVVQAESPLWPVMQAEGDMPLPPYVARPTGATPADKLDYQSLFAREAGAVAAPTASLHFTQRVVDALAQAGVAMVDVVLHVGPGTFLPIRPEHAADVRQHAMHGEAYDIAPATLEAVQRTRQAGGRVICVGTTSLRALETFAQTGAPRGESQLFVYPGFQFALADGLITNFHLPRSTLLLLVAAMAGRERVLAAYREAVAADYRFYSFGDAMLIV